jgi:hypothetical protein
MTPEEAKIKMQDITTSTSGDLEDIHVAMDNLLILILRDLGYSDMCDVFIEQHKWYA